MLLDCHPGVSFAELAWAAVHSLVSKMATLIFASQ